MVIIKMTFDQYDELEKDVQTRIAEEYERRNSGEISNTLMLLLSKNGDFPTMEQLKSYEPAFVKKPELFLPYLIFFSQDYEPSKDDITFDYDGFVETKRYLTHYLNSAIELTEGESSEKKKKTRPTVTRKRYNSLIKQAKRVEAQRQIMRQTETGSEISLKTYFHVADKMIDEEKMVEKMMAQIDDTNILQYLPMLLYYYTTYCPPDNKEMMERYKLLQTNIGLLLDMVQITEDAEEEGN